MASFLALAGCGDNLGSDVELWVLTDPALQRVPVEVVARSDSGEWFTPEVTAAAGQLVKYRFSATSVYSAYVTCSNRYSSLLSVRHGVSSSDLRQVFDCGGAIGGDAQRDVTVRGSVTEPASVSIGHATIRANAEPWNYTLVVPAGVHDVVVFTDDHVFVERDVDLTTDREMQRLSAYDGEVRRAVELEVSDSGGTLRSSSTLVTANGTVAPLSTLAPGATLHVPASIVDGTSIDVVSFSVTEIDGRHTRGVERNYDRDPEVRFLPKLDAASLPSVGARSASLPNLQDGEFVVVSLFDADRAASIEASEAWVREVGATSVEFDSIPVDPAWIARGSEQRVIHVYGDRSHGGRAWSFVSAP